MFAIELEYAPGHYVTCPILRAIELKDRKMIELLIFNPMSGDAEYLYDELR